MTRVDRTFGLSTCTHAALARRPYVPLMDKRATTLAMTFAAWIAITFLLLLGFLHYGFSLDNHPLDARLAAKLEITLAIVGGSGRWVIMLLAQSFGRRAFVIAAIVLGVLTLVPAYNLGIDGIGTLDRLAPHDRPEPGPTHCVELSGPGGISCPGG